MTEDEEALHGQADFEPIWRSVTQDGTGFYSGS